MIGKLWGRGCNQGRVWSCFKNSDRIEFSKLLCSFLLIWGCLFKFIISAWKLASKWPDMICGISVLFLLCFVLFFNLVCSFAAFSIWHCYDVIYVPVYIRGTHGFVWFLSALSFIQLVLFGTYKKNLSLFIVKAGKKSVRVVHLICCFQHTLCLCPCASWRTGLVLYLCSMQICPLLYGFKSCIATGSLWTYSLSNCVSKTCCWMAFILVASACGSWYCSLCHLRIAQVIHTLLDVAQHCWCSQNKHVFLKHTALIWQGWESHKEKEEVNATHSL